MPSKRSKPESVPSQIYPSFVCAMELIGALKNPSRIVQALCAYWFIASDGLRAERQREHAAAISTAQAVLPPQPAICIDASLSRSVDLSAFGASVILRETTRLR